MQAKESQPLSQLQPLPYTKAQIQCLSGIQPQFLLLHACDSGCSPRPTLKPVSQSDLGLYNHCKNQKEEQFLTQSEILHLKWHLWQKQQYNLWA